MKRLETTMNAIVPGNDIKALYPYPETANNFGLPYDYLAPQKNWIRPPVAGENIGDPFTYTYLLDENKVIFAQNTITKGEAAALNMPPIGWVVPPGVVPNDTNIPIPVDLSLLPPGDILVPSNDPFAPLPVIAVGGRLTDSQKIAKIYEWILKH